MSLVDFGFQKVDKEEIFETLKNKIGEEEAAKVAYKPEVLEVLRFDTELLQKNVLDELTLVIEKKEDKEFIKKYFSINASNQIKESKKIIQILRGQVENA